ncbi:MAG: amidohydrolase [Ignavibacteria bacterium]|nr:amidohydrolase [Ignavibacteria bacterium]
MKTLLYNGKIWLGKNYFASSVGFDDETGKIIFVGKNRSDDNNSYGSLIDLKGKLVLPAFMDGHVHLFKGSMVSYEVDLRYAKTASEFKERILAYKSNLKKEDWIIGGYFSETNFTEKFNVDRTLLDSICNEIPIVLFRTDLHSVICNSIALEKINIESKRNDFAYDELITDADGVLTGELKERAMYYTMKFFPVKTLEEKENILLDEISRLHKNGITAVTDISWREDLDVYYSLYKKNKLNLRINSVIPLSEFDKIYVYREEFIEYRDLIRFGGFKAFYDGSLSSHAALFYDNYKGTNYNGLRTEMVTNNEFRELGTQIDKAGFQLVVHAIGDLAVAEVLDFAEYLKEKNGSRNRRFRLEHAQHIKDKDLERFKKLDVIASVQPAHIFFDAKVADGLLVHPETTHVFKKLVDNNSMICFGTDFPVVPVNPFENIYYAITRKANGFPDGFNTQFSLDLNTCLKAYTYNNAFASYTERRAGSISEGKNADIIVLNNDLFNETTEALKETSVAMTYFNGKLLFSA